jgi:hypothetical protein
MGFGYMNFIQGPDSEIFSKAFGLYFVQWLIFWVINGLANVLLKRVVDPSWNEGKGLWMAMTSVNVLFTTENVWQLFLNVPLLRVVRKANHVAFWALAGVVEWCKTRDHAHDEFTSQC